MDTIRVDLPDGQWAEFYPELKHRTQKAVEELTRQYLTYPEGMDKLKVSQDGDTLKTSAQGKEIEVTIDMEKIDWTAVSEAQIINQVASWSFGEVSTQVMNDLPESVFEALKTAINKLYGGNGYPLAKGGGVNSEKGLPWLSRFRRGITSRRN